MSELDDDLRELLSDRARSVHAEESPPAELMRRARRRRIGTAAVAASALAGFVTLASLGVAGVLRNQERTAPAAGPTATTDDGWPAIWPHTSRAEAESAQTSADSGDADFVWQTSPLQVALRFATNELGWDAVVLLDNPPEPGADVPLGLRMYGCDMQPAVGCHARSTASIELERLIRSGPSGVWSVTQRVVEPHDVAPPSPDAPSPSPEPTGFLRDAERFALEFARARVVGEGAEQYLAAEAASAYERGEDGLSLYGGSEGYPGWEISGSDLLASDRAWVMVGLVAAVDSSGCLETFYEDITVATRGGTIEIVKADREEVWSSECAAG